MTAWICLASGPSMTPEDAELCRGRGKSIVINNTVQLAPWADYLYSCDPAWWQTYPDLWRGFAGQKVGLDLPGMPPEVHRLPFDVGAGLGDRIRTGHNSGHQAIGFAAMMGAKLIILVGYDFSRGHWHGDHPRPLGNFLCADICTAAMQPMAADLKAAGIRCINASRETALECYERMGLEEALALC